MELKNNKKGLGKKSQFGNKPKKLFNSIIRPDYFARFRFNIDGLIRYLKEVSGKSFMDAPFAFQCLDDLGYWTLIRESETFIFTLELERSLKNQFNLLSKIYDYEQGDVLIWSDIKKPISNRYQIQIVDKLTEGSQELYRIEILESKVTLLVSRFELDYWNAAGSSLPTDSLCEDIDWNQDYFWLKLLTNFKEQMSEDKFFFDFNQNEEMIVYQQKLLLEKVQKFFTLRVGELEQRHRGLGFLACGEGNQKDNALVMAFAIQALGQCFGIRARLWGQRHDHLLVPKFLLIRDCKSKVRLSEEIFSVLSDHSNIPIQRPISEVLRRVIATSTMFGKEELIPEKLETMDINDNSETHSSFSEIIGQPE